MDLLVNLPVVAKAPPAPRKAEGKHKSEDAPSFSDALEKASKKKESDEAEMAAASQAASQQAVQNQQPESKPVQENGQSGEDQAADASAAATPAVETTAQTGKEQGKVTAIFPAVETAETVVVETSEAQVEVEAAPELPETAPVETAPAAGPKGASPEIKAEAKTPVPVEMTPVEEADVQLEPVEGQPAPAPAKPAEVQAKESTPVPDPAAQLTGVSDADDNLSQTVMAELGKKSDASKVVTDGNSQAAQALNGVKLASVESSAGELARTAEARNPQMIGQISQGIETLAKSGNTSLHLQLYPEHLGKIDLRLVLRDSGMHVVMNADASMTGSMLERHLPELRQALIDAGVNVSGLTVGNGSAQNQPQGFERWQSESKKGAYRSRGVSLLEAEPVEVEPAALSRISSKVDYRV